MTCIVTERRARPRDGVQISEVQVDWLIPSADACSGWLAKLIEAGFNSHDDDGAQSTRAYGLPSPGNGGGHWVYFDAHRHQVEDETRLHITLRWSEVPKEPPPSNIEHTSQRVGGSSGLLDLLRKHWPLGPSSAHGAVTYVLSPGSHYDQALALVADSMPLKTQRSEYQTRAKVWATNRTNGPGLRGLSISSRKSSVVVSAFGENEVAPGLAAFDSIDSSYWEEIFEILSTASVTAEAENSDEVADF